MKEIISISRKIVYKASERANLFDLLCRKVLFDMATQKSTNLMKPMNIDVQGVLLGLLPLIKQRFKDKIQKIRKLIRDVEDKIPLLKVPNTKSILGLKVSGVDGSNALRRFVGLDLAVISSVIATLRLEKEYDVTINPFAKVEDITNPEADILIDLLRSNLELKTALEAVDVIHPDILFLDGTLVSSLTEQSMAVRASASNLFKENMGLLTNLLLRAKENNTTVAGIVKRVRTALYLERIIPKEKARELKLHDGLILDSILNEVQLKNGSRYITQPITLDRKKSKNALAIFYYKPCREASPIRVDIPTYILNDEDKMQKLLAVLFQTASPFDGTPLPVILAHEFCTLHKGIVDAISQEISFSIAELGQKGMIFVTERRGTHV